MMSNFRFFRFVAVSAWACTASSLALAQEPIAAKLYDQGVNAYFAGRACQADLLLSDAIKWNSQDPRAYYFRALSLLRQGRVDEARGDMLVGSMVEAQTPQRYAVGAALERIQGADRLLLEKFRNQSRRDMAHNPAPAAKAQSPVQNTTYIEHDAAVLREKRVVPLEELLRPGGPQSVVDVPVEPTTIPPQAGQPAAAPAPMAASPEDPFADDSQKPAPAAVPPAETTPPVKTPPQAEAEPAPPAAASTAPAATSPATSDEDPFN